MTERKKFIMSCENIQKRRDEKRVDEKNWEMIDKGIKPDIVFFGDSITDLWNVEDVFSNFGTIVNNGISGDPVHVMAERFQCDVIDLKPELCVFMGGVNNIWELDALFEAKDMDGYIKKRSEILELLDKSWRKILSTAKKNGQKMLVCSVMPLYESYRGNFVFDADILLKALCEVYGFTYVDYFSAVCNDDNRTMKTGLTKEGLHPIDTGYAIMEKVLRPELEKILNRR